MTTTDCDVLIVGGGLVGSALALTLAQLPLRVVLTESHDVSVQAQPGFDARATALANATIQILRNLAVWDGIAPAAEAISSIHVSESGRFGAARITAEAEGVEALGYTIENRELGAALWAALGSEESFGDGAAALDGERFRVLAPAQFLGMRTLADGIEARIGGAGGEQRLRARVLVGADGARSGVREALGLGAQRIDYGQSAVIFNCLPQRPLEGLAIERFTPGGPLAVLPLPQGRGGVVWSMDSARAQALLHVSDAELQRRFDAALGGRLGPILRFGERAYFPLQRVRARGIIGPRAVLIGSAAVNLHPVAGQGFNLAMRDIACLAEVFADALRHDPRTADIGAHAVLDRYARWRHRDHTGIGALTHGLIRVFGLNVPGAAPARGLALLAFDLLPGAKRAFARLAMGRAGRTPRLVCGQPLFEAARLPGALHE